MKRSRLTVAVAAAVGLAAFGAAPGAVGAGTKYRAPARLLVYAQEWSLWPSRQAVGAGPVIVQLWNRGEDAHDLRIRRLHHGRMTGHTQGVSVTASGTVSQASWRLAPGTYELYCSMPGHLRRGMHTRIVVR
jgi:plastocyanin